MSDSSFTLARIISVLIDIGLPSIILLILLKLPGKSYNKMHFGKFIAAILLTAILSLIKLVILLFMRVSPFGAIHVVYDTLFISLPIVAILLLILNIVTKFHFTRLVLCSTICVVILCPLIQGYATWIEPYRLQFERHTVTIDPARQGSKHILIGVLADIQTSVVSDHERDAINMLLAAQPDIILIPGDLFSGGFTGLMTQREPLRELLGSLTAPGGVYFSPGNTEYNYDKVALLDGLDIRILDNDSVTFDLKDRIITIAGLELECERPDAVQTTKTLEEMLGDDDIRILMTHRPDGVLNLPDSVRSRTDLVVAGHTHGGQVVIPFFGPPITLSNVPRKIAAGGLHDMNGTMIYVSRGLGWEGGRAPRVRFLCPPEITLLTIE